MVKLQNLLFFQNKVQKPMMLKIIIEIDRLF
jgi:hypothetical protein